MKVLVVLAACVVIASARPEPPVGGYSHHHGGGGGGGGHHGGAHGGHSGYNYAQPQPAYTAPSAGAVSQFSGQAAVGASSFDSLGFGGGASAGAFSGAQVQSFGGQSSSFGAAQAQSFAAPQQQIVQKHIYVHVPPPEPEQSFQQQIVAPGLRQKHYKIIFIKTPSVQPSAAQLALQQSLTEEKTIVYVLVKKPEALGDISLPAPSVSKPSKPEVYFIKYKTNSEQVPLGVAAGTSSGVAQADAGLGLLSSSGSASAATAGAGSGHAPAQSYGAPGHHQGYH